MPTPSDLPAHGALADEHDELNWDTAAHGRMVEHATLGREVPTVTFLVED